MDLFVAFLYAAGSVVCHQLPERSFFIDGRQLPVCARCSALYLSGLGGVGAWMAWKAGRRWRPIALPPPRAVVALVAVAGMPTALSYVTGVTAVWDGSNLTRALLAVPLGATAGMVVAAVATKDLR